MHKKLRNTLFPLILFAVMTAIAAAQGTGRIDGEVRDLQGNPYPDVSITVKSPDTGQTLTTKTDKNGKFIVLGLRTGIYNLSLANEKDHLTYQDQMHVEEQGENKYSINFKDVMAKQKAAHPEEDKAKEEDAKKFEGLKAHFQAGVAAMTDAKTLKAQPSATDQASKDKLASDYQTAVTEFTAAEQAAGPKDVKNHSLVWAQLASAQEGLGKYDEAAADFDKANALIPTASYYVGEATDLAKANKFDEANATCPKAVALDPATGVTCWKNLGIVLNNSGKMKEAIIPLQKATTAEPKDAQAWFLLGNALSATIDTKQVGEKMTYIIPPGTKEAYQKCIDANPSGPYAAQAKAALDGLQSLDEGADTTVGKRAKKKSS